MITPSFYRKLPCRFSFRGKERGRGPRILKERPPPVTPRPKKFAMPYRLRGRAHFFTWSQVPDDTTHDNAFSTLGDCTPFQYAIVARERHANGGLHYHAYVEWSRAIDCLAGDNLNLRGQHPNIIAKRDRRSRAAARQYCKKDGDWQEKGETSILPGENPEETTLCEKAANCSSWSIWLDTAYKSDIPYAYAKAAWDATNTQSVTICDGHPESGTITSPLLNWIRYDEADSRALVLLGPSGIGKTTWGIRFAPRPALLVSHADDLRAFREGHHRSIIFDDMMFAADATSGYKGWPRTSQIHLLDFFLTRSIHCRYVNARIPKGIHKIFTCNVFPFTEDPAIRRRIKVIDMYDETNNNW